jgi:hypothetical protein
MSELFELIDEDEAADGCTWRVQRVDMDGKIHTHQLRLSWADYDLFAPGGTIRPVQVAEAVFRFIIDHDAFQPLPERIDAAVPRRRVPGADDMIANLIRD